MVLCGTEVVIKTSVVLFPAIVGIWSQWPSGIISDLCYKRFF